MLSAQHLRLGLRAKTQGVERTEDHMTGDLHPHGQNSPDIPMSSIQNFFTLRFHFRRDIGMAGAETSEPYHPVWANEDGSTADRGPARLAARDSSYFGRFDVLLIRTRRMDGFRDGSAFSHTAPSPIVTKD